MIVNQKSLFNLRVLLDLILLNISFLLSALLAQPTEVLYQRSYMFILLLIQNILWYFTTNISGFYDDFNIKYFSDQFISIIKNTIAQAFSAILFIFVAKEDLYTRNFILYYSFLLVVLISIRIVLFHKILKTLRKKGKNIRKLIIIGAGEIGIDFYKMLSSNPNFGYRFVGFVDDTNSRVENYLGKLDELESIVLNEDVEEAVIALPRTESKKIDEIIKICNRNAVRTHIIPDYFQFTSKKFKIGMFGNFPIITVRNEPLAEVQWRFIKRTFDLIFSVLFILLVFSWLIIIVGLIIKLNSKGPIFFIQDRIGYRNKKFKCYKFRSMYHEKSLGQKEFKPTIENDPRVTSVGRFLRKANLDELPQFINVLLGDMSIVGPRPHAVEFDETYFDFFDSLRLRYLVRPGITGWAQVHGLRGDVADKEENRLRTIKRIEYDLWYIENWTFWLDLQIILLTVWQMIKGQARGV